MPTVVACDLIIALSTGSYSLFVGMEKGGCSYKERISAEYYDGRM